MDSSNKKPVQNEQISANDAALEKLEEMWDRQILKGDDELFESRFRTRPEEKKSDLNEKDEPVKQRRRRGRKI